MTPPASTQLRLDTSSDLAGAEDLADTLARALAAVLDPEQGFDAQTRAIDALAEYSGYCRPSCGFLDDGVCHTPDPDACACICAHDEANDPVDQPRDHPRLAR